MNSLTENLANFLQILRTLGIRVSSAEAVDAMEGLALINPLDDKEFKTTLKSTLVKTSDDQPVFEEAFKLFFVSPEQKEQSQSAWEQKRQEQAQQTQQAGQELVFKGKPLNLPDDLKNVYSRLPEEHKQRLRDFLEKTSTGHKVEEKFQPMVEKLVKSSLTYLQNQLSPEDLAELANARRQSTGVAEIDRIVESAAGQGGDNKSALLYKNMQDITEDEIPQVTVLVKRLAHRLTTHISRRYRQTAKRKLIDLRQSIRRNMRYGGTMLSLKYKTQKIHKPRIVILCDVSASMAKYIRFTLPFLFGLSRVVKHIESFIFANDLEKTTTYFHQGEDFDKATDNLLSSSAQMGQGTNLFVALNTLKQEYNYLLSSSTLLMIVSDAKTLSPLETAEQLKLVSRQVKKILWLNTQPQERWETNTAIPLFQKSCQMVECYSLVHLLRILKGNLDQGR